MPSDRTRTLAAGGATHRPCNLADPGGTSAAAPYRARHRIVTPYRSGIGHARERLRTGRYHHAIPYHGTAHNGSRIDAARDRRTDEQQPPRNGPELPAGVEQFYEFSRGKRHSFFGRNRIPDRRVQRLSDPAGRRAQYRIVLHAYSQSRLQ